MNGISERWQLRSSSMDRKKRGKSLVLIVVMMFVAKIMIIL